MIETELIEQIRMEKTGFKGIEKAANALWRAHSAEECVTLAEALYTSADYPVRELAVFLLGHASANSPRAMHDLRQTVSRDDNWRVQEILAKAFDTFCRNRGYEASLPKIRNWLADDHPNVRRAVTEGLRIWTGRDYFREHPDQAVQLLAALKDDESTYVRKSVGNALKDISKKHPDLIRAELAQWDVSQKPVRQVYDLAMKHLQ
ncbi:MAG: HEAT repeat domain-containing protein [Sporolactobacillus sp.]